MGRVDGRTMLITGAASGVGVGRAGMSLAALLLTDLDSETGSRIHGVEVRRARHPRELCAPAARQHTDGGRRRARRISSEAVGR